jgi:hypothetical protein
VKVRPKGRFSSKKSKPFGFTAVSKKNDAFLKERQKAQVGVKLS